MIFLSNAQGTITAIVPTPLYQGSNNVNELILIAPFPASNVVTYALTLPNGQHVTPALSELADPESINALTLLPDFSGKITNAEGAGYNAWRAVLNYPLTAISGDITVQFFVSSGAGTVPTSATVFSIEGGVPIISGSMPSEDNWQAILEALSAATQALTEIDVKVEAAETALENVQTTIEEAGLMPSEGLLYTPSADGTYNIVSLGTCVDDNIIIAAVVDNLPVKVIGSFEGSEAQSIRIPYTATEIAPRAFKNCKRLRTMKIPGSVLTVGAGAFIGCTALRCVKVGECVGRTSADSQPEPDDD
jgi:hypothetical protein